jgi:hypothetical protein
MDGVGGNIVSNMGIHSVEKLTSPTRFVLRCAWVSDTIVDGTNTDLEVIRGCDKTSATCGAAEASDGFNNLANFGGTPYIPKVNPAVEGIRT